MNAQIAILAYGLLIAGLFVLNRDRNTRSSLALWLPTIWLSICASRMISAWFSTDAPEVTANQYLEGSPLDRALLAVLVLLGLAVLFRRKHRVAGIVRSNSAIFLFVLYCAFSIAWSDFPAIAFKRWVKSLGDITMVLIVLTENNPLTAVKRWLSRAGFLLVPLSILFIKYFPDLGRGYNRFTWGAFYKGVAMGKNELGIICLIFGIFAVWRILHIRNERQRARSRAPLTAMLILLVMISWLFWMANSMTSLACFITSSILVLAAGLRLSLRKRWLIHATIAAMLAVIVSTLFFGMGSEIVETMGRSPTLTGRTDLWALVLNMSGNPLLGSGFESFWLGSRLEKIWAIYWWHPNEVHNGYIEVFLNLGWIGVVLLAFVLIAGYRNVIEAYRRNPEEGRLRIALFFTAATYNCTESAVRIMHPIWIFLLLAAIAVPGGWSRVRSRETTSLAAKAFQAEETPILVT